MRGIPLLVAALVLGWSPGLNAQQIPDAVLVQLKPGQLLRLRLTDGSTVEARLHALDAGLLNLSGHEAAVPSAMIDSLSVRGRAVATGAIVGGIAVAVPSFILFGWLCEGLSEVDGCREWGTVVGLGLVGGAVGALVGAVVGSAIPKWRLKYARATVTPGLEASGFGVTLELRF